MRSLGDTNQPCKPSRTLMLPFDSDLDVKLSIDLRSAQEMSASADVILLIARQEGR
jgi:hypothetical protein